MHKDDPLISWVAERSWGRMCMFSTSLAGVTECILQKSASNATESSTVAQLLQNLTVFSTALKSKQIINDPQTSSACSHLYSPRWHLNIPHVSAAASTVILNMFPVILTVKNIQYCFKTFRTNMIQRSQQYVDLIYLARTENLRNQHV